MKRFPIFSGLAGVLVMIGAGLLGSGCTSLRMTFENRPQVTLPAKTVQPYAVDKVELVCGECGAAMVPARCGHPHFPPWGDKDFGNRIKERAAARYPQLFRRDRTAIPVTVTIACTNKMNGDAAVVFGVLTLMVSPCIIPFWPIEQDFTARVSIRDPEGQLVYGEATGKGQRAEWITLFTPLGLIPVPGPSDVPKAAGTPFSEKGIDEVATAYITDNLVDILAAELLKLNPAALAARRPTGTPLDNTPVPDAMTLPNF